MVNMTIQLESLSSSSQSNTSNSVWNSLLANWAADLNSLLNNPSLQQNLWGQIEALAPIAAKCGSAPFANDFLTLVKQYQAFLTNPSSATLAPITFEINSKLTPSAPPNPLPCNIPLADQTCELLLYKINPYNPDSNQDEIEGILTAIQLFTPQTYQSQVTQIESDYSNYTKSKNIMYLEWMETATNALIGMLKP